LTQGRNDTEDGTILKWNTRSDHAVQAANERKAEQAIAATVGNAMTLDQATEYAERFMGDYAKVLLDESTLYVERDEPTDQHAFNVAERKEAQMARDLAEALAAAGVGTCTIVKTWTDSDYADHWRYSCSECGYQIEVGERDIATGNPTSHANFCWNCGRRCIGIKEEEDA
jgi:rubrerythrin